jgi:hypothetical protein
MAPKRSNKQPKVVMRGMCAECGEVVEVERVLVVGEKTMRLWRCRAKEHRAVQAATVRSERV